MIIKSCEDSKLQEMTSFLNGRELGISVLSSRIESYDFTSNRKSKSITPKIGKAEIIKNEIPDFEMFKTNTAAIIKNKSVKKKRASSEDSSIFDFNNFRKQRALSLDDLHQSKDYIIKRLIQLLNELFPDYDFSLVRPTQFVMHSKSTCIQNINSRLAEVTVGDSQFLQKMWHAVNESVDLPNCEIFDYHPTDIGDGPFSDGIWSFNYFFYNEDLKRLCIFFCKAEVIPLNENTYAEDDDLEEEEMMIDDDDDCSSYGMDVSSDSD